MSKFHEPKLHIFRNFKHLFRQTLIEMDPDLEDSSKLPPISDSKRQQLAKGTLGSSNFVIFCAYFFVLLELGGL
jgi:hypothetical protein